MLLFRRLLLIALVLLTATLPAFDYSRVREQILAIAIVCAILALSIALLVGRRLVLRVRGLQRLAEGLPGGTSKDRPVDEALDDFESLERSVIGVATELRRLLDRLRYESARREAILAGMSEGVLAVDRNLRVTFCNSAFLKAMDCRHAYFEGAPLLEVVRDTGLHELLRSVLSSGKDHKLRITVSTASARTFEVQATPLEMPSGRGAIAIMHDTTDLERLEQVRKDFVANVSHEFRTPLAGIIGYSDTLLDGALEDLKSNRNFVDIIRTNAVRLNSIASDLLILSELESGSDAPEPDVISIQDVLDSAMDTVQTEARLRDVRLIREEIENVYVSGSRLRLEQALLNLMANAIKFNRPGGEVRVRAGRHPGDRVFITISDTGVGIPSRDLPRIFERFYRVDQARSKEVGGTGLGLSIVKHVVERMNGTIGVESQLGKGSSFTVLLPAAGAGTTPPIVTEL